MMKTVGMLFLLGLVVAPCQAQTAPLQQPFRPGESLIYQARIGSIARGSGEMRVEGPVAIRGRDTYLLRFDFRGGAGPIRMEGRTSSWLDPETMTAMRFHKHERSPLGTNAETFNLFAAQGIWRSDRGTEGSMPSRLPLDELSFLYYIRTLPLKAGATYRMDRHFDASRNPVEIRVVGREWVRVPAGEFATIVVEMKVPQDGHVSGNGVIRLYLTDDAWRVPVRIESSVRVLGRVVFQLESSNRHSAAGVALR
ncbi:hypothetical protein BH23GEM8_BH23GEM8_03860 [soil metagenome]